MYRIILLFLIILVAWCPSAFGQFVQQTHGGVLAPAGCNASTDYIGDKTNTYSDNFQLTSNEMLCMAYTSNCSVNGSFAYSYIKHAGTNSDAGKICVYSNDADAPDNGDLKVGNCTAEFSSNVDGDWIQGAAKITGTATGSGSFYICLITGSTWSLYRDTSAGGTLYKDTSRTDYASPNGDLTATTSWASFSPRAISWYVVIE